MKKQELLRTLSSCGWWFLRQGKKHELWTHGEIQQAVPRHNDINEITAKNIMKIAKLNKRDE